MGWHTHQPADELCAYLIKMMFALSVHDAAAIPSPAPLRPMLARTIPPPSAGDTNHRACDRDSAHDTTTLAHDHLPARATHPTLSADRAVLISHGNSARDRLHNPYRRHQKAISQARVRDNISAHPAHASARCVQSKCAQRPHRDKSSWFSYAPRVDYYAL